ncbi:hypothetical protein HYALB_00011881 [Hymenoscyphus albidus]|uniref:Vacuolar membrane protein n=1 Tax=Hymenoscyphus albidus TaxID=595503 RepID=A0A9N9LJL4_9HELO|nr:hypothetical protein HYALB_00011881 [Hymenoscyphus albidus]
MLPPPGSEASLLPLLESIPTGALSSAIATATSVLPTAAHALSTATGAAAAIATAAVASQSSDGSPYNEPPNGECQLLGPFAILVQGSLGLCALLALVFKRWRERPQRPVKIWFFDVSKQVVGSVLVHIANLLMSMMSSGQFSIKLDPATVAQRRALDNRGEYQPNPCSFYLLNLAIDTTIGIPILIFLLRILTALFARTEFGTPRESIESGNYDNPPRSLWWLKQSFIYFLGLLGMKICVLIIFLVLPWISRVGDWALRWTEGNEVLQVIFVMLVFPVIMNATQYYIIDSFIKNQNPDHAHELIPDHDDTARVVNRYEDPRDGGDEDSDSDEDPEVQVKADIVRKAHKKNRHGSGSNDYDPLFDGETSPTVVGSASTSHRTRLEGDDEGKKSNR